MRSHGAHTYRSTGDIFDAPISYIDIFKSQIDNVEGNGPGCYNDMDMLITGMHGKGHVGLEGCTDAQYLQHFALWAFLGSPLIIGADLRSLDPVNKDVILNPGLISINQDDECRPAFCISKVGENGFCIAKILSGGRIAIGMFNVSETDNVWCGARINVSFDDLGLHSETNLGLKLTDAFTGEELGVFHDGFSFEVGAYGSKVLIGEIVNG